jgi:GAF domain-containing protein
MKIDELQQSLREGPALTAVEESRTVLVTDVTAQPRWQEWSVRAANMGIRAVMAACLRTERRVLGTVTGYSSEPGRFDNNDADTLALLADHASVVLDLLWQESALRDVADARNVIGQAQGLLMERYGLSSHDAFASLRRISRETGDQLSDVARELIITRELPAGYHEG